MPNRVIREGILDSEPVNALSWPAEVFYRRLMSVVDDFGRFDGRPSMLRSRLYPLKVAEVREADISRWIAECEKAGLIALYAVAGKPYILFPKLGSPRAKDSKFPPPPPDGAEPRTPADAGTCKQMRADEIMCAQMQADAPYSYSGSGTGSGTGTGTGSKECSEPALPTSEPAPVMIFPTVGTGPKEWALTEAKLAEYRESFPGIDVLAEARKARQWCIDNANRRKTASGMPAFLGKWFTNTTNGPGRTASAPASRETIAEKVARIRRENEEKRAREAS